MPLQRVADVARVIEGLAPLAWASEWDNVGLLVGSLDAPVRRCLVALDCDDRVLDLAAELEAELVVCHHPVVFHPLRRLNPTDPAVRAARLGIGVYAAHTNIDAASVGTSRWLAARLGVVDDDVLEVRGRETLYKLVTFVPLAYIEAVSAAVFAAGGGRMGRYEACGFQTSGTGTFRPLPGAHPFIGVPGALERVEEVRFEVLVAAAAVEATVAALRATHPYEEVAYDLIELRNPGPAYGFGRVGRIEGGPLALSEFAVHVARRLNCAAIARRVGQADRPVQRVAVCGGAGAGLVDAAVEAGADVLVTGDVKYHEARAAELRGLALVDAGHYATELPLVSGLADILRAHLAGSVAVAVDEGGTDVWRGVADP